MKKVLSIFATTALLALTGCATIVGDKEQTITLNSNPTNANVSITDERGVETFAGSTPTTLQLKKSDGSYFGGKTYTVAINKEGYDPRQFTIESKANGWYIGGNIIFGGLVGWLVVDPLTGAMYNLTPSEINADLNESVATNDDGGKTLNIVLLEQVPSRLHDELVLIGQA